MDVKTLTGDLRLAFPIRYAEMPVTRMADEKDDDWKRREGQTVLEPVVWAYHVPVSREVFESNYRSLSAANMTLFMRGPAFAIEAGPLIATMTLRDAARLDALESGLPFEGDPIAGLLGELRRLTTILAPSPNGYSYEPVDIAISRGAITAEDWKEAESSLVFFTCGLWMARREKRESKRAVLASVLRGLNTSSTVTEFAASLQPSTTASPSVTQTRSSVPV